MWVESPSKVPWASGEAALAAAEELAAKINATSTEAVADLSGEDIEVPSLFSKQGAVGVVSIRGSLFSSAPDWAKMLFGVIDYPMIQDAVAQAARDPEIGAILLDIDSPGGAVTGVQATADLISSVSKGLKPVHAFSENLMASAAYWLGSSADKVFASDLAEVGSVGVITRHREFSKAEAEAGITTTTIRSGPYKQIANPYEALTQAGKDDLQSKVDYMYGKFLAHVAEQRGVPLSTADTTFGQGKTFFGPQAAAGGLIDGVSTYAKTLDGLQKIASENVDKRKSLIQNPKKQQEGSGMPRKASLTDAEIAALASGASAVVTPTPEGQPTAADTDPAPTAEAEAEVQEGGKPEAAKPVSAADPAAVADEATAADPAAVADEATAAVVAVLKEQLAAAQADLLTAKVEVSKLTESLAAAQVASEALAPIARAAATNMCVAMNLPHAHIASLDVPALVAEHGSLAERFKKTFPVGGVSAAGGDKAGTPTVDPINKARLAATRFAK